MTIRGTKTQHAEQRMYRLPVLRDELLVYATRRADWQSGGFVFTSRTSRKLSDDNVPNRVLAPAVKMASPALEKAARPRRCPTT